MTKVIRFLESLAGNPASNRLSVAEYAAAVSALDATEEQRHALLDGNHLELNRLLGGREKLMCTVFSPDKEQQEDGVDEPVPLDDEPAAS